MYKTWSRSLTHFFASFPAASLVASNSVPRHQRQSARPLVSRLLTFQQRECTPAPAQPRAPTLTRAPSAASLVNTFVNYSISLGLGIAGTVETHVNRGGRTPADTLRGYRAAFYLGIGFSGLGILLALANLLVARAEARRNPQGAAEKQSPAPRASEDGSQERTRLEHADAQGTSAGRDGPAEKKAQGAQAAA
jgi:hypothetical protein